MAQEYLTISSAGFGEYTEKRSRFLGEVHPAGTEEEAAAFVAASRKKYYDARHHCYAWILGDDGASKKAADDGEPSGTAGMPMLKVLEGAGCTNVVAVVTRYFGGTLLGTGGLVRAYTQAVKEALANAPLVRMCPCIQYTLTMDYGSLDRVLFYLRQNGLEPGDQTYTDKVQLTVTVEESGADRFLKEMTALSSGRIVPQEAARGLLPVAVSGNN